MHLFPIHLYFLLRIQRSPVFFGTSGPTSPVDVSCDVGGGETEEHQALW